MLYLFIILALCLVGIVFLRLSQVNLYTKMSTLEAVIFSQGGEISRIRRGGDSLTQSLYGLTSTINLMRDDIRHLQESSETHNTQLDWIDERFNSLEHIIYKMYIEQMDVDLLLHLAGNGYKSPMKQHLEKFHNCKDDTPDDGNEPKPPQDVTPDDLPELFKHLFGIKPPNIAQSFEEFLDHYANELKAVVVDWHSKYPDNMTQK